MRCWLCVVVRWLVMVAMCCVSLLLFVVRCVLLFVVCGIFDCCWCFALFVVRCLLLAGDVACG